MTETFNNFGSADSKSSAQSRAVLSEHAHDTAKALSSNTHKNHDASNVDDYDRYGTVYKFNKNADRTNNVDDYDRYGTVYKFNKNFDRTNEIDDYDRYGTVYKSRADGTNNDAEPALVHGAQLLARELPKGNIGSDGSINFGKVLEQTAEKTAFSKVGISKDHENRVKEISYPNGQIRKFGYDSEGTLNKITDVDGKVAKLDAKSGEWAYETANDGTARDTDHSIFRMFRAKPKPDYVNPAVSTDGTLSYTALDGRNKTVHPDGSCTLIDLKEKSTVKSDCNGQITEVKYGTGKSIYFDFTQDSAGQNRLSKVSDSDGNSWRLKGNKWLVADGTDSGLSKINVSAEGIISETNKEGLTTSYSPNRSMSVEKPNHSSITEGLDGKISEIKYENGQRTQFEYFANGYQKGDLKKITSPDGLVMHRGTDGSWLDGHGHDTGIHDLQIDVDGSYGYLDRGNHVVINGTDGNQTATSATYDQITQAAKDIYDEENHTAFRFAFANGNKVNDIIQSLSQTDRCAVERQYQAMYGKKLTDDITQHLNTDDSTRANENLFMADLQNDAARLIPDAVGSDSRPQREAFIDNMNIFLERAHQSGMSADEVARTLASTQSLLEATDGQVSQQLREQLAQQIMASAARPDHVAQGNNLTCNVTDIEIRTWFTHPAVMANMVADVALTGSYTARDGKLILIPPQNLVPEAESVYNPPNDGSRSFASQLIQGTLINDVGQRETTPKYFSCLPPTKDEPEINYWTDANGKPLVAQDGKFMPFEGIRFSDIGKEAERITGVQKTTFLNRNVGGADGLVSFGDEQELREQLEQATKDRRLPIIIGVTDGDPLLGTAEPTRKPGGHVVCIDSYDARTGMAHLDNSWKLTYDKWVSIHDLYQATT